MLFEDTYRTIAAPSKGIFKDRGSKFIGFAFPVKMDSEVKALIGRLRTEHDKARHFCWALRLTSDRFVFRLSDDGEPSGTAGKPILNTLLSADLTDILIVVVHYFGGTLLGVPGLINAYKSAAAEAIDSAQIVEKTFNDVYILSFDYQKMDEVMKIIKNENLQMSKQLFDISCSLEISIRKSRVNEVIEKFNKIASLKSQFLVTL